jgi:SAM-dependent methyltransferase
MQRVKKFIKDRFVLRREYNDLWQEITLLHQENTNNIMLAQDLGKRIDNTALELVETLLQTRWMIARNEFVHFQPAPENEQGQSTAESFHIYLEKFKQLHPHLYETWASVNFGINVNEFKEHPERSCAVRTRPNARYFQGFAAPYLRGRVLDVGCGPYAIPLYLQDYPTQLISSIDPLEPFETHPFEFVRGFAEFLPWNNSTFDVVIAATTLDHVIALDVALSEIRRVLKPGGIFLTWDWFGENTPPYNPSEQSPQLIDQYHLFCFSEKWFEELMTRYFTIQEKIRLYGDWVHDYFYALQLKGK